MTRGELAKGKRRTIDVLRSMFPGEWTYHAPGAWTRSKRHGGGMAWWTGTIGYDGDLGEPSSLHFYPGDGGTPVRVLP